MMGRLRGAALLAWHEFRPSLTVGPWDVSTSNPETRGLAYWRPSWKSDLIAAVLSQRPGMFVDVGANIGQTLLDYLSSPVRNGYVGLEPSLECARHIKSVIDTNKLTDCSILPVALSDKAGVIEIFTTADTDPGATMVAELRPSLSSRAERIAALTYDDLELTDVSLVKIDVEGGELSVLRGMSGAMPAVLCEVLRRDANADPVQFGTRMRDTYELLTDRGMTVWLVIKSADLRHVDRFEPLSSFPDEVFGPGNRELNDYLFLPKGEAPPDCRPPSNNGLIGCDFEGSIGARYRPD